MVRLTFFQGLGLIYQHDGNVILDFVNQFAGVTDQTVAFVVKLNGTFAFWAGENVEKFFFDHCLPLKKIVYMQEAPCRIISPVLKKMHRDRWKIRVLNPEDTIHFLTIQKRVFLPECCCLEFFTGDWYNVPYFNGMNFSCKIVCPGRGLLHNEVYETGAAVIMILSLMHS